MSADDWAKLSGGNQVLWLKNGQAVEHTLHDNQGEFQVEIQTAGNAVPRR